MPFPNLDGREPAYTDEEAKQKVLGYWADCIETGKEKVPTVHGLANYMGTTSKTLKRYAEKETEYPQFCLSYAILFDSQAKELVNGGLTGDFNANVVKLMLFNHGYTDKVQTDNLNKNVDATPQIDPSKPVEQQLQDVLQRIKALQDEH